MRDLSEQLDEEKSVVRMYRKLHSEDRKEISKLELENFALRSQISNLRRKLEERR